MAGSQRAASAGWILGLTGAATVTTLVLACATPFTALAALAATRMRARDGVWLMVASWVASQAVGFGLHDYPRDATTLAWGAAMLAGAVAAVVIARAAAARAGGPEPVQLAVAYLAATVAFKGMIALWSIGLGGLGNALSGDILLRQLVRNGAILGVLWLMSHALVRVGVPAPARTSAAC